MYKQFEYMPDWIKVGVKVKIRFKNKWHTGVITSTPKENERGVEIKTKKYPMISLPVYMTETAPEQWDSLLRKI